MDNSSPPRIRKSLVALAIIFGLLGAFALGFGVSNSLNNGNLGASLTGYRLRGETVPAKIDFTLLWQAWNKIHSEYVGPINDQELVYGAVRGMVAGLDDPYTVYFDPEEAKRFAEDVDGKFYGVGIEIGMRNNMLTVITPIDDSPASRAGLRSGDVIVKIGDDDTHDMTLPDAVSRIRGQVGTVVKLTILPKDTTELKEISIARDLIKVASVKIEMKDNAIGYVRLAQFGQDTTASARSALENLKKNQVKGIILDLRNNPGGYLQGAQEIASMFIEQGIVVSEQEKGGKKRDLLTLGQVILPDTPLVVLINGGSASAAEIVAGAIQDHARGKLVGDKSFGKGSVQSINDLLGGSSLKVTIAEWFTPNGRQINKQGVKPDIEVTISADDEKNNRDPQLDKAIELLKQ